MTPEIAVNLKMQRQSWQVEGMCAGRIGGGCKQEEYLLTGGVPSCSEACHIAGLGLLAVH